MNRRIMSVTLMKNLQPFTQGGILKSVDAKKLIDAFVQGDVKPLKDFMYSPSIPVEYIELVNNLKPFIQ